MAEIPAKPIGGGTEPAPAPERETKLTIDDFRRLDLRVATITAAAPHPNADRLLVLQIDLGAEQRQLVAGIRAHYEPAALVGRQIIVVANLEPEGRRVTEFLGLAWHSNQAQHHTLSQPRFVFSPTYSAANQPVHTRAIGRWENYAEVLEPIQARLAPYCRTFGYA